jgi:RNA polymerase sigma factor (sigma-70 family)
MKTVASPSDGDNRQRDRRRLERDFGYVISGFSSPCVGRPSARYAAALANIHSSLFAMACHFYRREPNRNRREELAGNAVQEWYRNMQMKGFRAYLTGAEGRPFTPYAMRSLHHICVSLMRRTSREHSVASLDNFFDRRNDPRNAAELRELREDCREVMNVLPTHLRDCLRLIYWEGLSGREVAEQMRTNPRTVAAWTSRARQRLAVEFRKRGHGPL